MKILVVFTGGTIGSLQKGDWISNDDSAKYLLLGNYRKAVGENGVEFDTVEPYSILSEQLSATELTLLGKCISEKLYESYDGIIVTHGTDSLPYTAAALSYMFADSHLPIVLVSSDYTLEDTRANGNANFRAAVEFIESTPSAGVYVSYKNASADIVSIHLGTRLLQYTETTAELFSLDNQPFAFFDGKIRLNPDFRKSERSSATGAIKFSDEAHILVIESRPNDSFFYPLDAVSSVILRPYHSGTLNTESPAFRAFCNRAKEKNIPVFLVNNRGGVQYESSKLFGELSIEVLPFCSFTAIYMKCRLAESLGADIRSFVKTPLAQEFLILPPQNY